MALNYEDLMATSVVDLPFSYDDRESMLYALSIGMGRDPVNADELPYVFEQGEPVRTVPSMASVLVPDMSPPDLGWDFSQVLHIEQRLQLYRPLPIAADLLINKKIAAAYDHGPRRGALVLFEAEARLAQDDTALFTIGNTIMARADGGFGGPRGTGYYFDDIEVLRHPTNVVSRDNPHFFMINYAIGGISGWPIDLERYGNGSDMWVDYVRVYQDAGRSS